jgi:drug/metabolite transporter (DMT)-like permease
MMRLKTALSHPLTGLALIAASAVVWGTMPLFLRVIDGASVVKVFARVFFAALTVWGWLIVAGRTGEVTGLSRAKLAQVSVQGLILTLNWFLFLSALDLTNVATAELLAYTGPVFVAALAPFVTGERFDARILVPLALSLAGIVTILAPQGLAVAGGSQVLGAGLAFASALTYATLLLRSKKILRGVTGAALMAIEYPLASLVLSPFVMAAYARGDGPSGAVAYGALITIGVVHTALTGFMFLAGLRRTRTDQAAILTYAEPVSAVLFAAAFLGEGLTPPTAVGGALVVVGGIIVTRLGGRPGPIEEPVTEG